MEDTLNSILEAIDSIDLSYVYWEPVKPAFEHIFELQEFLPTVDSLRNEGYMEDEVNED